MRRLRLLHSFFYRWRVRISALRRETYRATTKIARKALAHWRQMLRLKSMVHQEYRIVRTRLWFRRWRLFGRLRKQDHALSMLHWDQTALAQRRSTSIDMKLRYDEMFSRFQRFQSTFVFRHWRRTVAMGRKLRRSKSAIDVLGPDVTCLHPADDRVHDERLPVSLCGDNSNNMAPMKHRVEKPSGHSPTTFGNVRPTINVPPTFSGIEAEHRSLDVRKCWSHWRSAFASRGFDVVRREVSKTVKCVA